MLLPCHSVHLTQTARRCRDVQRSEHQRPQSFGNTTGVDAGMEAAADPVINGALQGVKPPRAAFRTGKRIIDSTDHVPHGRTALRPRLRQSEMSFHIWPGIGTR